jgi:hypothetical protein
VAAARQCLWFLNLPWPAAGWWMQMPCVGLSVGYALACRHIRDGGWQPLTHITPGALLLLLLPSRNPAGAAAAAQSGAVPAGWPQRDDLCPRSGHCPPAVCHRWVRSLSDVTGAAASAVLLGLEQRRVAANAPLQDCGSGRCCRRCCRQCCSLTKELCMLLAAAGGKDTFLRVWTQDGQQLQKLELGDQ